MCNLHEIVGARAMITVSHIELTFMCAECLLDGSTVHYYHLRGLTSACEHSSQRSLHLILEEKCDYFIELIQVKHACLD